MKATRIEQTLELGERIFADLVRDRALIPEAQLAEVRYDRLCGHEVEEVERLYQELDLGDFEAARPAPQTYVDGLAGYQPNRLSLDEASKARVAARWRVAFEAFGYEP